MNLSTQTLGSQRITRMTHVNTIIPVINIQMTYTHMSIHTITFHGLSRAATIALLT
jgi:hypothetical protein